MTLLIVHYHLRPGGIRRVIELATPALARFGVGSGRRRRGWSPIRRVILAVGEAVESRWRQRLAEALSPVALSVHVEPAFGYLAEQRRSPKAIRNQVRRALDSLLEALTAESGVVWAHNLGVGRNWILTEELARACAARGVPLLSHHHDWWFDHRWARWAELRALRKQARLAAAQALFPCKGPVVHLAINRADAAVLQKHCGARTVWLPNLTTLQPPPAIERIRFARRWLAARCGEGAAGGEATFWISATRVLRRKNLAEALLLTRWLRPGAWLVVTGAASSEAERPYARALVDAARRFGWRMRLGLLANEEAHPPSVAELLAACEVVLLTSIQEGFGLPYLEAAAARRPLLARRLPNITPDLHALGFRFPHAYEEIRVAPELFDWRAERIRQAAAFRAWRRTLPRFAARLVREPPLLRAQRPGPIPFSQLTLDAQLEVLAQPVAESWAACAPLNPFLERWRQLAADGQLRPTRWPGQASRHLGPESYARGWFGALRRANRTLPSRFSAMRLQDEFIRIKLAGAHLHPLLWNPAT